MTWNSLGNDDLYSKKTGAIFSSVKPFERSPVFTDRGKMAGIDGVVSKAKACRTPFECSS
ncbi:hypothetical protein DPMN_044469 [Dreissena polymorpha]|uniref:Uncharacterized protein n=1 Tax=Dreissena polymorpha TaxID=45954 RepID=A0A9D4D4N7_DREPO|nr:hypothetical protein DPMN_044469 [Dreissena polymorpha]